MTPESPIVELPVLNTIIPLIPEVPEFAVLNNNEPDDLRPTPDIIETFPPVDDEARPALSTTCPPVPLVPEPTVKYKEPPRPDTAVPDPR